MTLKNIFLTAPVLLLPAMLLGQGKGVSPSDLLKPLKEEWTSYNGD